MTGGVASPVFIGRAVELGRLDAVLERAGQGSPQVVLLAGDAGWARPACCWRWPTGPAGDGLYNGTNPYIRPFNHS